MTPIAVIGEAFGETEEALKLPFVGSSGQELTRMLAEAEIFRYSCVTCGDQHSVNYIKPGGAWLCNSCRIWQAPSTFPLWNVFMFRPSGNKIDTLCGKKKEVSHCLGSISQGKYILDEYIPHLEVLKNWLLKVKPNIVIALGNTATWALCGNSGISSLRGTIVESSLCPGQKVIPAYHPAAILRQWDLRAVTIIDFKKAKHESLFSEIRRPRREIWIDPSIMDLWDFYKYLAASSSISYDIETKPSIGITCIGFASDNERALVVPFLDQRQKDGNYWRSQTDEIEAWRFVKEVLTKTPAKKVTQNGMYDLSYLWTQVGIPAPIDNDTMLCHHAMHPEAPKALGFLGSVYCNDIAWKLLRNKKSDSFKKDE